MVALRPQLRLLVRTFLGWGLHSVGGTLSRQPEGHKGLGKKGVLGDRSKSPHARETAQPVFELHALSPLSFTEKGHPSSKFS